MDGLLCIDPDKIPSQGELFERLKRYAYVLARFPDNQGVSGGYFAPVAELIMDYSPFFINNYLLHEKRNAIAVSWYGLNRLVQMSFVHDSFVVQGLLTGLLVADRHLPALYINEK